jgi:hypothetical protein
MKEDGDMTVGEMFRVEGDTQKVGDRSVEGGLEVLCPFSFEVFLNGVGCAEVDEVIDVQSDIQRWFPWDDGAGEYTWWVRKRLEAEFDKSCTGFFIPVAGRTFETVKGAKKAPERILGCLGASWGRAKNVRFIFRKGTLAESLGDVAALGNSFHRDSERHEETEFGLGEDGCVTVRFWPGSGIMVAENDDAVFCAFGVTLGIFLDGGYSHSRKGAACVWEKAFVFVFCYDFPSRQGHEAVVFFGICGVPGYAVRRRQVVMSEKSGRL